MGRDSNSNFAHFLPFYTLTSEQFMRVRSEAEGWRTGMDGYSDDSGNSDPSKLNASIFGDCCEKKDEKKRCEIDRTLRIHIRHRRY